MNTQNYEKYVVENTDEIMDELWPLSNNERRELALVTDADAAKKFYNKYHDCTKYKTILEKAMNNIPGEYSEIAAEVAGYLNVIHDDGITLRISRSYREEPENVKEKIEALKQNGLFFEYFKELLRISRENLRKERCYERSFDLSNMERFARNYAPKWLKETGIKTYGEIFAKYINEISEKGIAHPQLYAASELKTLKDRLPDVYEYEYLGKSPYFKTETEEHREKRWNVENTIKNIEKYNMNLTDIFAMMDYADSLSYEQIAKLERGSGIEQPKNKITKLTELNEDVSKLSMEELFDLAESESTSPEVLKEISGIKNELLRAEVAGNINTPWVALRNLSRDENKHVRAMVARNENASADILRALSKDEDVVVRSNVAENENTPVELLEELSKDKSFGVRMGVAMNPRTPPGILSELSNDNDTGVRFWVTMNPSTSVEDILRIVNDKIIGGMLSKNEHMPEEVLRQLAGNEDPYIRAGIAGNPGTPLEVVSDLTKDKNEDVSKRAKTELNRRANDMNKTIMEVRQPGAEYSAESTEFSKNTNQKEKENVIRNCDINLLYKFAENEDWGVRGVVAMREDTPEEILIKLADDEEWMVRALVSIRGNVPEEVLLKLAADKNAHVREMAAGNKKLPLEVLKNLAQDQDWKVRRAAAMNESSDAEVLTKLADDKRVEVRMAVAANPNTPPDVLIKLSKDEIENVKARVAMNESTPAQTLINLSVEERWFKVAVAGNKSAPEKLLKHLAESKDAYVRMSVAGNPGTPRDVLEMLKKDENKNVREKAVYSLNNVLKDEEVNIVKSPEAEYDTDNLKSEIEALSDEEREAKADKPDTEPKILSILSKDKNWNVRANVADNKNTPVEILDELSKDESSRLRAIVALNLNTSKETLDNLANDEELFVRSAVAKNTNAMNKTLRRLVKDKIPGVRGSVAYNENAPGDLLIKLTKDKVKNVRELGEKALENRGIKTGEEIAEVHEPDEEYLSDVNLELSKLTKKELEKIVNDENEDYTTRGYAAKSPKLSVKTLKKLSQNEDWVIRAGVALNPAAPAEILVELAEDEDYVVRANVAGNESAPEEVLEKLTNDASEEVLSNLALNPNTKTETLEKLAKYDDVDVRKNVALNPKTTLKTLRYLTNDKDDIIRQLAEDILEDIELKKRKVKMNKEITEVHEPEEKLLNEYGDLSLLTADEIEKLAESGVDVLEVEVGKLNLPDYEEFNRRLKVAGDWNTAPEIVEEIANDTKENFLIRSRAAGNPNLSVKTLIKLARDDDWVIQEGVALTPSAPPALLAELAENESESVRAAVAINPSTPDEILDKLSNDWHSEVLVSLALNPKLKKEKLAVLAEDEDFAVRSAVAKNTYAATAEIFSKFAEDKNISVRLSAARNPNTPIEVLEKLSRDEKSDIRAEIAMNKNTPVKVLEILSKDKDGYVRGGVAANLNASPKTLDLLSRDKDYEVRNNVVFNHSVPVEVLKHLSEDKDECVRGNAECWLKKINATDRDAHETVGELLKRMENKMNEFKSNEDEGMVKSTEMPYNADSEELVFQPQKWDLLAYRLKDTEIAVKGIVLEVYDRGDVRTNNDGVRTKDEYIGIVKRNAQDIIYTESYYRTNESYRKSMFENYGLPIEENGQRIAYEEDMRIVVAEDPATSVEQLKEFAKDSNNFIRAAVARNESATDEILNELAKDKDLNVRFTTAAHRGLPAEAMITLSKDKSEDVRYQIACNKSASPDVLKTLAKDNNADLRLKVVNNPNITPEILGLMADDTEWIRIDIAENKKAPVEVLEKLSEDESASVRMGVVSNPNTPGQVLRKRANDIDPDIREIVARHSNTPVEALIDLSFDMEEDGDGRIICASAARNENMPSYVLERLAKNEEESVLIGVIQNDNTPLKCLEELSNSEWKSIRKEVAHCRRTGPEILDKMAGDKNEDVRWMVALNKNTSAETLAKLALDTDIYILRAVAANPNTSADVLTKLATNEDKTINEIAKESLNKLDGQTSPKTPLEVRENTNSYGNSFALPSKNKSTKEETEIKDQNAHIADIRSMFIEALEKDNLPFNKEYKSEEAELPYINGDEQLFENSNVVAAALHMAKIGSDDPRYFDEDEVFKFGSISTDAKPLMAAFKGADLEGNQKEMLLNFYNGAQIKGIEPYEFPYEETPDNEPVVAAKCETPEAQLKENITQWQVALAASRPFVPPKTEFTNQDYIAAIKSMTENQLSVLCYGSGKEAERILEGQKKETGLENQNKIEGGGVKL